ncbi:D-cysteine desulfhydrase [Nitrincola nitratireducens]|uniref:D-cysteine desulfhydrase n=1 Tax=Nitrincola nitratireducens TaxID=1229521 RepID=W9V882_9GAMM|nr:D-cysteine desulfhydrase [Nitrincola nitratireducens]
MHIPSQPYSNALIRQKCLDVSIIRLDLSHPQISGNKWFKLEPVLKRSLASCTRRPLLSFGGCYSNHLHALAYAGYHYGIPTIGVVRGERPCPLNATLQDAESWGMALHFVSRQEYRNKTHPDFTQALYEQFGDFELIPEGGSSPEAVLSCANIGSFLAVSDFDYVLCPLGTGATAAGLLLGKPKNCHLIVVPALQISAQEARSMLSQHLAEMSQPMPEGLTVLDGTLPYGKINAELAALWYKTSRLWDPLYTLRMYQAFCRLVMSDTFPQGSRIALFHTGGMQGVRGCKSKIERLAPEFQGPLPL